MFSLITTLLIYLSNLSVRVSFASTTPTQLKDDEYLERGRVPLELKV